MFRFISSIAAAVCFSVVSSFPASTYFSGYCFSSELKTFGRSVLTENREGARDVVYVENGQEYSIVVHNPLPVQVAVAVTVDGLNTIDGKRTKASDAAKWMIEANSSIVIDGWQTSSRTLRRFVFTKEKKSYATWKQSRDKKNYTQNLGVVGIAWFWNSEELEDALRPVYSYSEEGLSADKNLQSAGAAAPSCRSRSDAPAESKKEKAGTGMGHQQLNHVTKVHFEYDTGMYRAHDVLKIYYEFAQNEPLPQPFDDERSSGYAPEMDRNR